MIIMLTIVVTQFSPIKHPLLIPIAVVLTCLSLFVITILFLKSLNISYKLHFVAGFYVIIGVVLSLQSLHQLHFSDLLMIVGLSFLLNLYSKR